MYYKVKPKDSLSKIAKKFSLPLQLILSFNRQISNINHLQIGQVIYIPNTADVPADAVLTVSATADTLINRARSAINKQIRYKLGAGGMDPDAPLPTGGKFCDCSGFVCWVLGISRKSSIPFYKQHGGWIYTDSMVADINSQSGIFEKINIPEPGCIVVYGAGNKIGHVGLVSAVEKGAMKKVIHCSSGNDRRFRDSIQETSPSLFNRADTFWGRFAQPNL
jgi:LysM repeat protein